MTDALGIQLGLGEEASAEELDEATRDELAELDVESVERPPGELTLGEDGIEISGGSAAYQREMIETFPAARARG